MRGALRLGLFGALRFSDDLQEQAFRDHFRKVSMLQTGTICAVAGVVTFIYMPWDHWFYQGDTLTSLYLMRFYLGPMTLLWGYLSLRLKGREEFYYRFVMLTCIPIQFMFPAISWYGQGEGYLYSSIGQTQVAIFIALLMRLPMQFVIPSVISMISFFCIVTASYDISKDQYAIAVIPVLAVSAFATIFAYRTDFDARKAWMVSEENRELIAIQKRTDEDRLDWLSNLSRFLRHEFRNSMLGVSTSLDRLDKKLKMMR